MTNVFNYIPRSSPIHALTGAAKLVCMLCWTMAAMITFDTRYLLFLCVSALLLFRLSDIHLRDVKVFLVFVTVFMVLNNVLIYLFAPEYGVEMYGARTLLFTIWGHYTVTTQQLLYHANVILKYGVTIPMVLLFVSTTQPSEFAASLNRIGVSYRIAYSVSLALRYIPDILKEYRDISLAQQARGVELSGKENLFKRLKGASAILLPLILSSLERIEVVATAMELRCFGKKEKRTWYRARAFARGDYLIMAAGGLLVVGSLVLWVLNGSRMWNPFV